MTNTVANSAETAAEKPMQTVNVLSASAATSAPPVSAPAPGSATAVFRQRQQYSLAEKLSIVRESQQPGVSQAHVSRKYNLGKNVLWSWRRALAGFSLDAMGMAPGTGDEELVS